MSWWPAASGEAFSWDWQAFPGVWLLVAALGAGYVAALRGPGRRQTLVGEPAATGRELLWFGLGLAVLWLAVDWPLGVLGTGYSLTARITQHILIGLVATPLLLLGLPEWMASALIRPRLVRLPLQQLLRPWVASLLFDAVFLLSIIPPVVNGWQPSQLGSFALTMAWLASGLLAWWPLVAPAGAFGRLNYLLVAPYLFTQFLLPKIPAIFYIFSSEPYYALYRDAPRVWSSISATTDQQMAGGVIWLAGGILIVSALYMMMLRWQRDERMQGVVRDLGLPASPRAVGLLFEEPGAWEALQRLASIARATLEAIPADARFGLGFRPPDGLEPGSPEALRAAERDQVVLEIGVALNPVQQLELWEQIERRYGMYLEGVGRPRAVAIRRRVSFQVVEWRAAPQG
jgi:cytochrome c oxidase assembly factor CtaG